MIGCMSKMTMDAALFSAVSSTPVGSFLRRALPALASGVKPSSVALSGARATYPAVSFLAYIGSPCRAISVIPASASPPSEVTRAA